MQRGLINSLCSTNMGVYLTFLVILITYDAGCDIIPNGNENVRLKETETPFSSKESKVIDGEHFDCKNEFSAKENDYFKNDWPSGDDRINQKSGKTGYTDEEIRQLDKMYGFTGPTANDEPENLMRPCSLQDWECIRKYFAANGKCKPVYGPIPDPMIFDVMTVYYTLANFTVSFPDGQIRGLSSAKVKEFYVNKKTKNLVFAFDIQDFNQTLPRAYFRYRRTAKESIILPGYGTVNYRSVTFTAVIPMVPDLRLDLADVHIYIQDPIQPFFVSPEASASSDPDVQAALAEFVALRILANREGTFFQAPLLTSLFIQKNICDFGLKLIST